MTQNKPKLLDRVRNSFRQRNYAYSTEQTYTNWITRYILFHDKKHPREMREKEIEEYLTHLAVEENGSPPTQNQALSALIYLYQEVLHIDLGEINAIRPKRRENLPTVLTQEEIQTLLPMLNGLNQLMAKVLYGSGPRISECLRLRVKDVDFGHSQILVHDGKGHKDRFTILPQSIQTPLREQVAEGRSCSVSDVLKRSVSLFRSYRLKVESEVVYPPRFFILA